MNAAHIFIPSQHLTHLPLKDYPEASNESSPVIHSDPGETGHFNGFGQKHLSKEMAHQNFNIFQLHFTSSY
jgi:hypothetical protein